MPSISSVGSGGIVDISLAPVLAPTTSTRNIIQGTGAGVIPLSARGFAGQTADVFTAEASDGTDYLRIDSSGILRALRGVGYNVTPVSANYTATVNDHVIFATSAAASGSWNAAVTALAPQGWYKLDDSTTTATDSGSGAHNGTYAGTYAQTQTALLTGSTNSVQFTNGEVAIGDFYDFTGTAAFSIGFWFKPDTVDSSTRRIIGKEVTDGSGLQSWKIQLNSTSGLFVTRARDGGQDTTTSTFVPSVGTTYFIMYTYSGTQSRLYINGSLDRGPLTHGRSMLDTATSLHVGRSPTDIGAYQGFLDEVLIFNSEIASSDASNLYTLGTGGGGAGPITITLPAANALGSSTTQELFIYKADASGGSVTVSRAGSDTVNGLTSVVISTQHAGVRLLSNGVDKWFANTLS